MLEKFRNQFRVPSARLENWDYGSQGSYFITFNTENHTPYFGEIQNGEMILSDIGLIAHNLWKMIPEHFPYMLLDEFIIMPEHIHGILFLDAVQMRFIATSENLPRGGITSHHNPMIHQNIPRVIRWYKGRCTYEIRKLLPDFTWHNRYYDRVIRNTAELNRIRKYILENPAKYKNHT